VVLLVADAGFAQRRRGRGHAAWALGRIASRTEISGNDITAVAAGLARRLAIEDDPWVREEISAASSS
jgi:hypothetical protein